MLNREKVIKNLQSVTNICALNGDIQSMRAVDDALTLLEEKTPIEATEKQKEFAEKFGITVPQYWCGECHYMLAFLTRFCPNCGKKVKWDA